MNDVPTLERAEELLWQAGHPRIAEQLHDEVEQLRAERDRLHRVLYPGPVDAVKLGEKP